MGCVNPKNANDPKRELPKNEKAATKPPIEIPHGIPADRFNPPIGQVDAAPRVETAPPPQALKQVASSKLKEVAHPVSQVREVVSGNGQEVSSIPLQLRGVVGQSNLLKSVVPLPSNPPQTYIPQVIPHQPLHNAEQMHPVDASNIKIQIPLHPQHRYEDPYKALISEAPLSYPNPLQAPPQSNLHSKRPQISRLAEPLPRSEIQDLNSTVKDMESIHDSIGRDKSRVQVARELEVVQEYEESEIVNDQNFANYTVPISLRLADIRFQ